MPSVASYILALAFCGAAMATPTSPHRARQSSGPCSWYTCPPNYGPDGIALNTIAPSGDGGFMCTYEGGLSDGGLQAICQYSTSSTTPLSSSSVECPTSVCVQAPACNTVYSQCPAADSDGDLFDQHPFVLDQFEGINGPVLACDYPILSGPDKDAVWSCYYAELTGQLVEGGGPCATTSLCGSSARRGWEAITTRETLSEEEAIEDLRPW
ncbi:hypothetical protein CALCODRAFT_491279 [Calocera cornea HHB12733]|uniref:Ig-like domain-containing protein n=1 Tax=Calocera cornea HHB12733 TaxID=1353952 RepID=A0A165J769_9BASI|nr:hypothetical protein CALCODRAFT_491279 [Calocera cornea HHB12733]